MKHVFFQLIAYAVILSAASAAPPKLSLTASKATTSGGTSINVAKDERVTIQVAAEPGSAIAVVTFPEFTYISPANKSELTFYATVNCRVVVVAFKGVEATQQKIDVVVSGSPTPPGPGPDPTPTPTPTPGPIPTSAVGKAAYDAGMASKSPTRVADCQAMIGGLLKYRPMLAAMTAKAPPADAITKVANGFQVKDAQGKLKTFATRDEAIAAVNSTEIIGKIVTYMLGALSEDAKKHWGGLTGPLVTKYALPLSSAVKDKATGLQAIDDTIAGLKAVTP